MKTGAAQKRKQRKESVKIGSNISERKNIALMKTIDEWMGVNKDRLLEELSKNVICVLPYGIIKLNNEALYQNMSPKVQKF